MQHAWLENQRIRFKTDGDTPSTRPGEALIRVQLAGVCGTDIQLLKGYGSFSGIPGHEFVGEVVEAPDHPEWLHKRVVGEINIACGQCDMCRARQPTHCRQRRVLGIRRQHGAFAQYLVLPIDNLHAVPDDMSDETAVFTEPSAAALEILTQINVREQDKILVIGAGRLGQLIAQVLKTTPGTLHVAARHERQRALLADARIDTISPEDIPLSQYDVVVDTGGSTDSFKTALNAVKPRGVVIVKSTHNEHYPLPLADIVVNEISIIGSRCGPFKDAMQALRSKMIKPEPLIDAVYPLHDIEKAFAHAQTKGTMKILVRP